MVDFNFLQAHVMINHRPPDAKQFRFPKSKKKRIIRKWEKRPENFKPGESLVYRIGDTLFCPPDVYQLLVAEIASGKVEHNLYENVWTGALKNEFYK